MTILADGQRGATFQTITPDNIRNAVLSGMDVIVVDVSEGPKYAAGHISVAVPIASSELELRLPSVAPRLSAPVVVVSSEDDEFSMEAASRIADLGYTDVRYLPGGNTAWTEAGNILITGEHALSKALGEFVERRYHTPRISVEELRAKIDSGQDIAILDTRPREEFQNISIPGGVDAPGVELLYRIYDRVQQPTTQVVVNCAGRTRAIIGAQALINAEFPNPVVSLENGTTAWLLAGFEPSEGSADELAPPSPEGIAAAAAAASQIARRFGVPTIDREQLGLLREDAADRTLYIFDVRTEAEYLGSHLPGARWAAGGQLVQTTDQFIGSRNATIVLVDNADGVRARVTASWLIQLGLPHVFVYLPDEHDPAEPGAASARPTHDRSGLDLVSPLDLRADIETGRAAVVDLEPPAPYYRERPFIPGSFVGRRSTLRRHHGRLTGLGNDIVLTSGDGTLAELAALDGPLAGRLRLRVLDGGTTSWRAAGLATETGPGQQPLDPGEAIQPPPDLDQRRSNLADYVAWGDDIVSELRRDGLVSFTEPPDSPSPTAHREQQ